MRDVNLELGGLLLDMATLVGNSQRAWGYKRAAKAVFRLDRHDVPPRDRNAKLSPADRACASATARF